MKNYPACSQASRFGYKVSEKNVFEHSICLSRLLHIFANIIDQCKCRCKEWWPRSESDPVHYCMTIEAWTLLKHFRWQKVTTFVVIDTLRVYYSLFQNFLSRIPSVKQFGFRSDLIFCRAKSGAKLFAKVVRSKQRVKWLKSRYLTLYSIIILTRPDNTSSRSLSFRALNSG